MREPSELGTVETLSSGARVAHDTSKRMGSNLHVRALQEVGRTVRVCAEFVGPLQQAGS
jgi:hypothetical protein